MRLVPSIQTISFFDSVSALSKRTLVSQRITSPFMVRRLRAAFPAGVDRQMTLRFYVVGTKEAPTDAPPSGASLLKAVGQVDYLTGDDNVIDVAHEVVSHEANQYLAVYADNADTFDHTIECQVTIEFIDPAILETE